MWLGVGLRRIRNKIAFPQSKILDLYFMDDLNEMARLHSAGAIVRHNPPFDHLLSHKNKGELTADFIQKWVRPFYMAIGSHENQNWIESIKEIKSEITTDICLTLLGDFNWRTRLVGSYFAAVKGYRELIDVIGTHLLKSETCCVGHIYAQILAFFNTEKSVQYLHTYLDYYLMRPDLYFDQEAVLKALLYLCRDGEMSQLKRHLDKWKLLVVERKILSQKSALSTAKLLEEQAGKGTADAYLQALAANPHDEETHVETEWFGKQIAILNDLNQYRS